jgi:tol-pal system protein YbgF
MRQGKIFCIGILFIALAMLGSCRPSRQTQRNTAANARNNPTSGAAARQLDSVYMVQDKLLTIIDTMSGIIAQDRARIRSLEIEIAKLRSLIEQQNIGGAIPPPAPPVNTPQQNYSAPTPQSNSYVPAPMQPLSPPANDKYSAALRMFNDGKYMDALTTFDELARTDGSSQYAPNYLYWKGESLYALGQYDEAVRTFHDVLNKYPASTKADDAEFKIGAAYEKLGDRTNARAAYERLTLSFPESEYKGRAQARLNKLK